ncbi:hypothetical protein [Pedobacter aquatilis]|uniref:putative polyvalent protein kinase domain-containing protein n=1 Tax=Pedobacter aquatilis TaxID=351343 RepID=UPI00292CB8F0|nr:hypothetical protein [Pedobacter aquatilis]
MTTIKNELRDIIIGNGPTGETSKLKKTQNFLRRNEKASRKFKKQEYLKSEEEIGLISFAKKENLFYHGEISEKEFICAGAEQRVYRYDDFSVIKLNDAVFYEYWLDYFNSLLIHNYFFQSTTYAFLGFKIVNDELFAVVKQDFIIANEITDLNTVRKFLSFNNFMNNRNNDYVNLQLGIIFEDLHDENVLTNNGIIYFVDTIFYLMKSFYE